MGLFEIFETVGLYQARHWKALEQEGLPPQACTKLTAESTKAIVQAIQGTVASLTENADKYGPFIDKLVEVAEKYGAVESREH